MYCILLISALLMFGNCFPAVGISDGNSSQIADPQSPFGYGGILVDPENIGNETSGNSTVPELQFRRCIWFCWWW
ncbi:hypothetical protein pipiens_003842 [Culex pipiens pipiens]|uniref:Secreted protein n=1 Tax=Culex pipiens pipiens TaxID=38569 RepID=A0ABD1CTR2_CULPP